MGRRPRDLLTGARDLHGGEILSCWPPWRLTRTANLPPKRTIQLKNRSLLILARSLNNGLGVQRPVENIPTLKKYKVGTHVLPEKVVLEGPAWF